jgi:hypothetical protein
MHAQLYHSFAPLTAFYIVPVVETVFVIPAKAGIQPLRSGPLLGDLSRGQTSPPRQSAWGRLAAGPLGPGGFAGVTLAAFAFRNRYYITPNTSDA